MQDYNITAAIECYNKFLANGSIKSCQKFEEAADLNIGHKFAWIQIELDLALVIEMTMDCAAFDIDHKERQILGSPQQTANIIGAGGWNAVDHQVWSWVPAL